jgi:anti-sigma B factor antagonist
VVSPALTRHTFSAIAGGGLKVDRRPAEEGGNDRRAFDREVDLMTASTSLLAPPFRTEVVVGPDEAVVAMTGELDLQSAEVLEREVVALHAAGHDRIVVDLGEIAFIDSTGLRVLLGLHRASERAGRRLSLVRGPDPVHRIFELTATAALFHWR